MASAKKRVLIVDDEPDIRELLEITLSRMGLDTISAADLAQALACLAEDNIDLCLTDMKLPDGTGLAVIEHIQNRYAHIPVAMNTAFGSVETAIEALKAGAFDFVTKPIDLERLRQLINSALKLGASEPASPVKLLGETDAVKQLRQQIAKVARSQAPVYISGESGSGKEVVARLIHANGPRSNGPFIPVNCGAIPSELMESELFGHTKGSFTGAHEEKRGLFEAANGGTLFLDEVADLPLNMQVKLLRAIQEKSVRKVGSNSELAIDVRILSATHKNLAAEVKADRFRSDLFYRINVIELKVPSLRERRDDIPLLARAFLARLAQDWEITVPTLADDALKVLSAYAFPGNVRELENILERAVTLCDGDLIDSADLQLDEPAAVDGLNLPQAPVDASEAFGHFEEYLEKIESDIILAALEKTRWNRTAAAKLLGISFRQLRYRLQKLNLDRDE
ncbi:MAG: sigma-54 dependent transcriptional regulator [Spongiibacteraceae bacterium]|jgi:two-component system response regulator PilR (NtrC family)|nr:sigma-54 dependent transcriptional regulator [Spongiibacteraceae bacterium]